MQFDSEARVIIGRKTSRNYRDIAFTVGSVTVYIVGLMLFAHFLRHDRVDTLGSGVTPPAVQDVRVIEDTSSSPTATRVACQIGLQQGDMCYYQFSPTPSPVCPPLASGWCVYDGPGSLVAPTEEPIVDFGSAVSPPDPT